MIHVYVISVQQQLRKIVRRRDQNHGSIITEMFRVKHQRRLKNVKIYRCKKSRQVAGFLIAILQQQPLMFAGLCPQTYSQIAFHL